MCRFAVRDRKTRLPQKFGRKIKVHHTREGSGEAKERSFKSFFPSLVPGRRAVIKEDMVWAADAVFTLFLVHVVTTHTAKSCVLSSWCHAPGTWPALWVMMSWSLLSEHGFAGVIFPCFLLSSCFIHWDHEFPRTKNLQWSITPDTKLVPSWYLLTQTLHRKVCRIYSVGGQISCSWIWSKMRFYPSILYFFSPR